MGWGGLIFICVVTCDYSLNKHNRLRSAKLEISYELPSSTTCQFNLEKILGLFYFKTILRQTSCLVIQNGANRSNFIIFADRLKMQDRTVFRPGLS